MSSHADPVVVGLSSTEGIYYALCRHCGAYTAISSDPSTVETELQAGIVRGALALQSQLALSAGGDDPVQCASRREVA